MHRGLRKALALPAMIGGFFAGSLCGSVTYQAIEHPSALPFIGAGAALGVILGAFISAPPGSKLVTVAVAYCVGAAAACALLSPPSAYPFPEDLYGISPRTYRTYEPIVATATAGAAAVFVCCITDWKSSKKRPTN